MDGGQIKDIHCRKHSFLAKPLRQRKVYQPEVGFLAPTLVTQLPSTCLSLSGIRKQKAGAENE